MTQKIVILLLMPFLISLSTLNKGRLKTLQYKAREGESLIDILDKMGLDEQIYGPQIKKHNPKIINWENLKEGTSLYIEYAVDADLSQSDDYNSSILKGDEDLQEEVFDKEKQSHSATDSEKSTAPSRVFLYEGRLKTLYYKANEGDSLSDILDNMGLNKQVYGPQIRKHNPKITNWENLTEGTTIYIEYTEDSQKVTSQGYPSLKMQMEKELEEIEEKKKIIVTKEKYPLISITTEIPSTATIVHLYNDNLCQTNIAQFKPLNKNSPYEIRSVKALKDGTYNFRIIYRYEDGRSGDCLPANSITYQVDTTPPTNLSNLTLQKSKAPETPAFRFFNAEINSTYSLFLGKNCDNFLESEKASNNFIDIQLPTLEYGKHIFSSNGIDSIGNQSSCYYHEEFNYHLKRKTPSISLHEPKVYLGEMTTPTLKVMNIADKSKVILYADRFCRKEVGKGEVNNGEALITTSPLNEGEYYFSFKISGFSECLTGKQKIYKLGKVPSVVPLIDASGVEQSFDAFSKEEKKKLSELNYEFAKKSFSLSVFYAISTGSFKESTESGSYTIKYRQTSPLTIGLFAAYREPGKMDNYFSGSAYLSRLNGVTGNFSNVVRVDPEVGINLYYNFLDENYFVYPYIGLDYESFSSFNIDQIDIGEIPASYKHQITFITAGVSKILTFGTRSFLTKVSLSRSILSSNNGTYNNKEDFGGYKYILYLSYLMNKNWNANIFYKQHLLSGPSDLEITRIGLGIGYRFF